jgi:hypothetical protein
VAAPRKASAEMMKSQVLVAFTVRFGPYSTSGPNG